MSPKLPRITAFELLRALKRDGWQQVRQREVSILPSLDVLQSLCILLEQLG